MWLSEEEVKGVKAYKYSGIDESICRKLFLGRYWDYCIRFVPLWMAYVMVVIINVFVTLLGFVAVVVAQFIMLSYIPDLQGEAPRWVYVFCGLAVQFYSLLDNLDGRQARRTGSSSALGELFDHGCDALNTGITTVLMAGMLSLGPSWGTLTLMLSLMLAFYGTTWEEYHTGCLYLGVVNGPDEGLLLLTVLFIFTGIVGPSFWLTSLKSYHHSLPDIQLNYVFLALQVIGCLFVIVTNFQKVIKSVSDKSKIKDAPEHKAKLSRALGQWRPVILMTLMCVLWAVLSDEIVTTHIALYMWIFTLMFSFLVGRLIVAYLCNLVFSPSQRTLYILESAVAFALFMFQSEKPMVPTSDLLWTCLGAYVMVYFLFVREILTRFTTQLNIYALSLKKPAAKQQ